MSLRYAATLNGAAYLCPVAMPAFDLGTGDFTLTAMLMSTAGGPLITRIPTSGAGWSLAVGPDGSVELTTRSTTGSVVATTAPAGVLDGDCHAVTGIRQDGTLQILVDGQPLPVTVTGTGVPDVSNDLPLAIGATGDGGAPLGRFTGMLMNVSVWSVALTDSALVAAMFGHLDGTEAGLQGAWSLDYTTDDRSPNDDPANMVGPVTFMPCVKCVWVESVNSFAFCRMTNHPDPGEVESRAELSGTGVAQQREIEVLPGSPAFAASIMATGDRPAFPAGSTFAVTDPTGRTFTSDVNSPTLTVVTSGGQLWALMALDPAPGTWTVSVTAPVGTGFTVDVQAVPAAAVVPTVAGALEPLYGDAALAGEPVGELLGGWLNILTKVAVAAVAGVVAAAVVVFSGGTALPAVVAGLVAFTSVSATFVNQALPELRPGLAGVSEQVAGAAGFVVAVDRLLLVDANVPADLATEYIYKRRAKVLYPYVEFSPFKDNQKSLIGDKDVRTGVESELAGFTSGYATMSGHGRPFYLTGWYRKGDEGPLQEVLWVDHYQPPEAAGKIFHMFACHCGYSGDSPGLGIDLVNNGAVAFFGYSGEFKMVWEQRFVFCDCDIEIDKALIDGADCDTAYQRAKAMFEAKIKRFEVNGEVRAAEALAADLARLVAPSTDPKYGRKDARLRVTGG